MGKSMPEIFPAFIYYGRPLEDLIEMAHFDDRSPTEINEKNFPRIKHEVGKRELEFRLYVFRGKVESEHVFKKMSEDGYCPATLREIIAFKIFNPYATGVIGLGSSWTPVDWPSPKVPYVVNFGTMRGLRYCLRLENFQTWYWKNSDERIVEPREWEDDYFLGVKQS